MKAKEYELMCHAIELGIKSGIRRAYKHSDQTPPDEIQQDYIITETMNSICEWFDFDESKEIA